MNENENKSLISTISSSLYSFIFELPFDNYHTLYKTGKIQKMSKEEKMKIILEKNEEAQHRHFFRRLLMIRPSFLDDEDQFNYNITNNKIKNFRLGVIVGLFLNWNYFAYNFFVKKRNNYKSFLSLNLMLVVVYIGVNKYSAQKQEELFQKYKEIIKKEEVFKVMKDSYRIE